MGQVLHGSATTTQAIRRAIQNSQESLRVLAKHYSINQKTVAKWKKRTSVVDRATGPKNPRSSVLSPEDEAAIVAFRKHTLLLLNDCLYALQPSIPHLPVPRYTAACNGMTSHSCLTSMAIFLSRSVSRATPSATFISTSQRYKQHRASFISSSPLIARRSSHSPNCMARLARWQPRSSCAIWLRLYPTAFIQY